MKESSADSVEVLASAVVSLAKGELRLAGMVGLTAEDLGKILHLGLAKLNSGRHDEAIDILEGLIALDGSQPVFWEYLGVALEAKKRFDEALDAYTTSIARIERLGTHPLLTETLLLRSRLHAVAGHTAEAVSDLSRAKQLGPTEPDLVEMMSDLERLVSQRGEA